jgi:hypothetical protein
MRVMMIKADPDPGATPSEELLAEMDRYNDELNKAGVLVDLAGLFPSAVGRRVRFSGGNRSVLDGPFPDPKQVIAGSWTSRCRRWTRPWSGPSVPVRGPSRIYPGEYGAEGELEIRQVFEPEE